MIERAPFGATGHESSRVIFGAAALGARLQGGRRPHARAAARARHQPHRRRRQLRRRGAADRHLAQREHEFFVATKTGERTYAAAARGDPPLARAARRRPRRLDPAAQPRRRDRVGHRAQPRRRAGGLHRGARGGPGALHRRHRPRALSIPKMHQRSLERFDFDSRAVPVQLRADAGPALRGDVRRAGRGCAPSATSRCRRSRASPARRGRAASTPRRRGTSRSPTRPTSTWRCTGCSATRRSFLLTTGDVDVLPKLLDAAERFARAPVRRGDGARSSSRRCSPDGGGRRQAAARSRIQPASAVAVIGRPR